MTQNTETRRRPPLRPLAGVAFGLAGIAGLVGAAFAPLWRHDLPQGFDRVYDWRMVDIGHAPVALPVLLLVATVAETLRPSPARWLPLLAGALMTVAAIGWGHIHWITTVAYAAGRPYYDIRVTVHPGLGVYLYGAAGIVALVLGALIIVAPRRMRATPG